MQNNETNVLPKKLSIQISGVARANVRPTSVLKLGREWVSFNIEIMQAANHIHNNIKVKIILFE